VSEDRFCMAAIVLHRVRFFYHWVSYVVDDSR